MKKSFAIIGALFLMMLSLDVLAQSNEQAAAGKGAAALRRECGPEAGPFRYEVVSATPCPNGGTSYVIFYYQPTPCSPRPQPCIQVIQPIGTAVVDCEGNTTVQCGDGGGPIPL